VKTKIIPKTNPTKLNDSHFESSHAS